MAKNLLKPEQDVLFRQFYTMLINNPEVLEESPAHRRQLVAICLEALNYRQLSNGAHISRDVVVSVPFGGSIDETKYPDEWVIDTENAYEAIGGEDTLEASPSSEAESAEVREAVLSEDV